jgi:hypothetical protein
MHLLIFFLLVNFGVHYIWYQRKGYNTWTLNRAKNVFLAHEFLFNEKLTKHLLLQTKKFISVVIMATQNEEEIRLEENPEKGPTREPGQNNEGSFSTQVLETMRNLIVELQVFKEDNEKLKKAQQEQQEINEVLLRSIVTKKSPKDNNQEEEVNKRASKNSGPEAEKGDNSSEGTPSTEDKTTTGRKRK